jgi:hypothetical protein
VSEWRAKSGEEELAEMEPAARADMGEPMDLFRFMVGGQFFIVCEVEDAHSIAAAFDDQSARYFESNGCASSARFVIQAQAGSGSARGASETEAPTGIALVESSHVRVAERVVI